MKKLQVLQKLFVAFGFIYLTTIAAFAQTTVFTYQGKLSDSGTPQNVYEMQFKLFGSAGGNDQIGGTITNPNVSVNQGVFTVQLDLGVSAFPGADRYLQISVRRNASESFVTLNPRQQITSSPYSIRTLSAAQADVALDSEKLGGVDASEYVTTMSVGSSFIRNQTTQQTGNFNISGDGIVGGNVGIGVIPEAGFKLDVNGAGVFRTGNGRINFGSPNGETGMSVVSGGNRADLRFDGSTLKLLAGVGTVPPGNGLFISTSGGALVTGTNGDGAVITARRSAGDSFVNIDANVSNSSVLAYRKNNFNRWLMFANGTPESGFNTGSDFQLDAYNNAGGIANYLFIKRSSGNVGIGTVAPQTRLAINGGPAWTSNGWAGSLSMANASALGWEANASGQRFGIGQSTGGLYFFRTTSAFGTTSSPTVFDMQITDTGNISQPINNNGLVKAMLIVDNTGAILRCYNGITHNTTPTCGFTITRPLSGVVRINFGFSIANRFVSVTPEYATGECFTCGFNVGANYRFFNTTNIEVFTFQAGDTDNTYFARFMLILY